MHLLCNMTPLKKGSNSSKLKQIFCEISPRQTDNCILPCKRISPTYNQPAMVHSTILSIFLPSAQVEILYNFVVRVILGTDFQAVAPSN